MEVGLRDTPQIYYETDYTATAVSTSRSELLAWLKTVEKMPPFNKLVADRNDDEPHKCTLRVGLGYKNQGIKITHILEDAGLICANLPPKDIKDYLIKNPNTIHQIGEQSYQIIEHIGSGAYGDVFKAKDLETESFVAIKILRIEGDEEDCILQKLTNRGPHPNIIKLLAKGEKWGKRWLVMPIIDGVIRVKYDGPWTTDLQAQYDSALSFMVRNGVFTERENEDENVMITTIDGKPTVILIDFGTLARK